jgi:hypothetical protein
MEAKLPHAVLAEVFLHEVSGARSVALPKLLPAGLWAIGCHTLESDIVSRAGLCGRGVGGNAGLVAAYTSSACQLPASCCLDGGQLTTIVVCG